MRGSKCTSDTYIYGICLVFYPLKAYELTLASRSSDVLFPVSVTFTVEDRYCAVVVSPSSELMFSVPFRARHCAMQDISTAHVRARGITLENDK